MKLWQAPRPWLSPFVPLYRLGQALSEGRKPVRHLKWPVVSIGNLSTGGSGKTPLVIALAQSLKARGFWVDVLSRGYGRNTRGAMWVRPEGTAEDYGDEPLEIARAAQVAVIVAGERYEAGQRTESAVDSETELQIDEVCEHKVHLLDDGFQHRQLYRDVDILLVNPRDWTDWLLPAGNLREGLHAAARADVVAIPANEPEFEAALKAFLAKRNWQGQIWRLRRRMIVPPVNGPAVAFCGIARPEQFFAGLEAAGVKLIRKIAFGDHHRYSAADLERVRNAAASATLLTTEKDIARLGPLAAGLPLIAVPLRTEIENEDAAVEWLVARLRQASA